MLTASTLVLNQSFEPIKIISWQRAMTLLAQAKVEIIETHALTTRTPSFTFQLPAVVRLFHYVKTRARTVVPFTRHNLYLRDGHRCQYCEETFEADALTFDHVIPLAQGGQGGWENIVTACQPCNRKKADQTPEQARMPLARRPRRPPALPMLKVSQQARKTPVQWRDYLFLSDLPAN